MPLDQTSASLHPTDELLRWLDVDGRHQIVAIHAETGVVRGYETSVSGGFRFAAYHDPHVNYYYLVNEPASSAYLGTKVKKADIAKARAVWVDIDPPKDCTDIEAWKADQLIIHECDLTHNAAIIDSGGGLQLLWRFTGSIEECEAVNRKLAHRFGGDPATWNADRILRCPGTTNWPDARKRARGRVPAPTKLISLPAGPIVFVAADFADLPVPPARETATDDAALQAAYDELRASDWMEDPSQPCPDPRLWAYGYGDGLDHSANRIALARVYKEAGLSLTEYARAIHAWDLSGIHDEKHDSLQAKERQIVRAWTHASTRLQQEQAQRDPDRWFDPSVAATQWAGPAAEPSIFDLQPPEDTARPRRIFPTPVTAELVQQLPPPREWLYGKKILRRYTTVIGAPPGVGKTAYSTAVALSCASGIPLLGDAPHKPMKVWVLNLEDPRDEAMLRFHAAAKHHGLGPEVWNNLFVDSGRDMPICIVRTDRDGQAIVQDDLRELETAITENAIDIVVLDPWLRAHGVPENDNDLIDKVVARLNEVAERTRCAFVLVHHTKKGAEAGMADGLRGASALIGGARVIMMMSQMSVDDAKKWGVAEDMRRRYVRIDDAKANLAPVLGAEWVFLESVWLDNGNEEYPEGERVQVARLWSPEDPVAALEDAGRADLLAALAAGGGNGEPYTRHQTVRSDGAVDRCVFSMMKERFGYDKGPAQALLNSFMRQGLVVETDVRTKKGMRKGLVVTYKPEGDEGVFG